MKQTTKEYLYDAACEELAEYFLTDLSIKDKAPDLAQHLQDAAADWINANTESGT